MSAYNAIIATIVVASDASSVTKTMVNSTTWRAGTSGTWLTTSCTLTAGNTYQFRTENANFGTGSATLPNIKASVTVDWDTSGTVITTVGDDFMRYYAYGCTSLTSLSVLDTSSLTTVGDYFISSYARGCTSLTSLSIPDTSSLTTVGDYFMYTYAFGCTSLTSLSAPDTSSLTTIGTYFIGSYARGCTSLTSLSVPDTSSLTTVGYNFMDDYARDCSALLRLELPSAGLFKTNNVDWEVPSTRLTYLKGYVTNTTDETDWKALVVSGKTLYTNYIRSTANVIAEIPPTMTTQAVSDITRTTATGNGNLTNIGSSAITEKGICYGTSENPTTSNNKVTVSGTTTGAFTASLTGLSAGTTYYVRAYVINSVGTSYGSQVSFVTLVSISGTVTLSGTGVSGAVVRIIRQSTDTEVAKKTTDSNGDYEVAGLVKDALYHVCVEYTDGSSDKYNAKSLWNVIPG